MLKNILEWSNDNSGFLSLLGIAATFFATILAFYLGIMSARKLEKDSKRANIKELKELLLLEFFVNLDHISHIYEVYERNLNDRNNLRIPVKAPRVEIISRFMSPDMINSLNKNEKLSIINIYSQLELFNKEYYIWRDIIQNNPFIAKDELLYTMYSKPMINHLDNLVENIMQEWVNIVNVLGKGSDIELINKLSKDINKSIKSGKWIKVYYKSSGYSNEPIEVKDKVDIILCWKNDDQEIDKEVIEIRTYIPVDGF